MERENWNHEEKRIGIMKRREDWNHEEMIGIMT